MQGIFDGLIPIRPSRDIPLVQPNRDAVVLEFCPQFECKFLVLTSVANKNVVAHNGKARTQMNGKKSETSNLLS